MEEKLRFVFEHEQGHRSMKELCQRNEIARETGYVWILSPAQHRMDRVNLRLNLTNRETRRPSCGADERFQLLQDGQSGTLILTKIITVRVIYIPFDQALRGTVRKLLHELAGHPLVHGDGEIKPAEVNLANVPG
jgi:hypothetical protein